MENFNHVNSNHPTDKAVVLKHFFMLNLSVSLGSISNLYDETMLGLYKTFGLENMFWLKMPAFAPTNTAGDVPTSNQKNLVIVATKTARNCPKMSLKIFTGLTKSF